MALSGRAVRGVLWSVLEFGGGEGISFAVFLLLARLLAPDDFGVVALAGTFILFVQTFLQQGFPDAVIQRQELTTDHCSTAFWSNVAVAALFTGLVLLLAAPAAELFREPLLEPVLRGLSPLFLTSALISIHVALFKRRLRFGPLALRSLVALAAGGVAGIVLALAGAGPWALVGQQLVNGVLSVAVIWWRSDWQPAFRFSPRCFAEMARFSATVIGSSLAGFFVRRLDVLLVGYFFDARQLGYYNLVQRLLAAVSIVTLAAVQAIVLPVLSRLQHRRDEFRDTFVVTFEAVQTVWTPIVIGVGLVAPLLLPLLFGPQWAPSVPLFQVLSLVGFTMGYSFFTGAVLYAVARPMVHLRLVLIQIGCFAVLILVGTKFGLVGVAAAYVATTALVMPLHVAALQQHAGIPPAALLGANRAALPGTLVMVGAVLALQHGLPGTVPASLALAVLVLAGAAAYLATAALAAPGAVQRLRGLLASAMDFGPRGDDRHAEPIPAAAPVVVRHGNAARYRRSGS